VTNALTIGYSTHISLQIRLFYTASLTNCGYPFLPDACLDFKLTICRLVIVRECLRLTHSLSILLAHCSLPRLISDLSGLVHPFLDVHHS